MSLLITLFWDVTLGSPAEINGRFGGSNCLIFEEYHLLGYDAV
jgi:hypothetical protein